MSLIDEAKKLSEILGKVKDKLGLQNKEVTSRSGSLFKALEVRKNSITHEHHDSKLIVNKAKKYHFRISFLRNAIQFLDIKSILNLSLVNKEFSYFVKSVYFYKFMSNVKEFSKKREILKLKQSKNIIVQSNTNVNTAQTQGQSTIFGSVVSAFGSVLGNICLILRLF